MIKEHKISVDIDITRIREIVTEALRMIHEYLEGEFIYTSDQILNKLDLMLSTGKVSTYFYLEIGSKKIPDLLLRVDPVRREVLCKSAFKKKVAKINHFVSVL